MSMQSRIDSFEQRYLSHNSHLVSLMVYWCSMFVSDNRLDATQSTLSKSQWLWLFGYLARAECRVLRWLCCFAFCTDLYILAETTVLISKAGYQFYAVLVLISWYQSLILGLSLKRWWVSIYLAVYLTSFIISNRKIVKKSIGYSYCGKSGIYKAQIRLIN